MYIKNDDGYTPLSHLCKWYNFILVRALNRLDTSPMLLLNPVQILADDEELARIWNNACLLLQVQYQGTIHSVLIQQSPKTTTATRSSSSCRILHACAGVSSCPEVFAALAMRLHPEQTSEADQNGNLPLHIMANSMSTTSSGEGEPELDNRLLLLHCLLLAYPIATRVRNANGDLPLHLVIRHGGKWESGGVKAIYDAFPGAVTRSDKGKNLFPFLMAATSARSHVEVVFLLLQACPELERFCNEELREVVDRCVVYF